MTAPQDDPALIHKLAAMTDREFEAVVARARGVTKQAAAEALSRHVKASNTPEAAAEALSRHIKGSSNTAKEQK